jgi:hypothetical protein
MIPLYLRATLLLDSVKPTTSTIERQRHVNISSISSALRQLDVTFSSLMRKIDILLNIVLDKLFTVRTFLILFVCMYHCVMPYAVAILLFQVTKGSFGILHTLFLVGLLALFCLTLLSGLGALYRRFKSAIDKIFTIFFIIGTICMICSSVYVELWYADNIFRFFVVGAVMIVTVGIAVTLVRYGRRHTSSSPEIGEAYRESGMGEDPP